MIESLLAASAMLVGVSHETSVAPGFSLSENVVYTSTRPRTQLVSLKLEHTFAAPGVTPLRLSLGVVAPNGVGANVWLPLVEVAGFRALLGLGAFYNAVSPMNNKGYSRPVDATAHLRLSQRVSKSLSVFIEQEQFILGTKPLHDFGPLSTPMYQESLLCGQTFIGVSQRW